jgi:antitoxin MazE
MFTTIQKWGNSKAVRIPKPILEKINLMENDSVELIAEENSIIIRKVSKKYKKLDDLFSGYNGDYCCKECDCGLPVGKEEI